jgi:E3 ubiquitin-protein ligase RAD18
MEPSSDPQEEDMVQGLSVLLYYGTAVLNSYTGGQMVNCPICNVSIVMGDINTHIDSGCKKKSFNASGAGTSDAKGQWTKLFLNKGKSRDNG